ncbi:DUF2000 domain-containing protein [Tsukamurella pseudospumae]|uniref:DUF2000 domain-containing protein n=1 Tax=Tsukamurella pseudospumae TaxID=239498 RepID=A0A137Z6X5_9ACTN|nr:DUF2000 domain-containing protein [Tsukamurella pseudospumae]KXO93936.1 hypothetical protein AXK61_05215 [Tsukamurella pseudospumae]
MTETIRFDTKIAVLLRDDLATWQRLNVTAFLVSGIATATPELIGEPYADADGTEYLPLFRQPVLVFEGSTENLRSAHERAVVRAVHRAGLDLVGTAVHGPRNAVDHILKGAHMHP